MNARELYYMLGDVAINKDFPDLRKYNLIGPDGRPISGVIFDHDKKQVILKQRDKRAEKRVDL